MCVCVCVCVCVRARVCACARATPSKLVLWQRFRHAFLLIRPKYQPRYYQSQGKIPVMSPSHSERMLGWHFVSCHRRPFYILIFRAFTRNFPYRATTYSSNPYRWQSVHVITTQAINLTPCRLKTEKFPVRLAFHSTTQFPRRFPLFSEWRNYQRIS
jgi:hypothetical protein